MATKPSSIFSQEDQNLVRLRKMCDTGSGRALRVVLKWVNPNWIESLSFLNYLRTKKSVKMKDLKNKLKRHQWKALTDDPQGDNYDISLLYTLVQWGNEGLADRNDDAWYREGTHLEILITSVKNVRNTLTHSKELISADLFALKTEKLRDLIKDMLICAGEMYEHITDEEVTQTIQDVDILLDKCRDDPLEPRDIAEYQKLCIFDKQSEFVIEEGKKALHILYATYSILTPLSHLVNVIFPVNEVFTDLVLLESSKKSHKIELCTLLERNNECNKDDIILLEGDAGVGKTTLVKKILSDWTNNICSIRFITSFNFIIHVECRDHFSSFKDVLNSLMAEVSKSFRLMDLMFITLNLNCLVILDGFDELNKVTANLFMEILQLKRYFEFTVIVTSRPEAITKYYQCIHSYQIQTRHVKLLGIPSEERDNFVRKYFSGLQRIYPVNQDISLLTKYLKRTERRLTSVWRLPYNLTILTILWSMRPDVINSITTEPELHWEMHQLYLSKLEERLCNSETTHHLHPTVIKAKVHQFIYSLCQVSLKALENDDITLPESAYQHLVNTCNEAEIPVEEMTGAFLKRTTTNSGTRYSYPHKGLQDFLAALFIWLKIVTPTMFLDISKIISSIDEAVAEYGMPEIINQNIKRLSKVELLKLNSYKVNEGAHNFDTDLVLKDLKSMLLENKISGNLGHEIYQSINKRLEQYFSLSSPSESSEKEAKDGYISKAIKEELGQAGLFSVTKFQNMFKILVGLFYLDKNCVVANETKLEALELLQRTGIEGKREWLQTLNSVKCDEFVALYLDKKVQMLDNYTEITDANIFAYISFLRVSKPTSGNIVNVLINVKENVAEVCELLNFFRVHEPELIDIYITNENMMNYTQMFKSMPSYNPPSHCTVRLHINSFACLPDIVDSLYEIKRHNFVIARLELYPTNIKISDDIEDYTTMFKKIPDCLPLATSLTVNIYIKIEKQTPLTINELLKEISRLMFPVMMQFSYHFLNPGSITIPEDVLNGVFEKCVVDGYKGGLTNAMEFSQNITNYFSVSVADADSYRGLLKYIANCDTSNLSVCMSHQLISISHLLEPLPENSSLYITDINIKMDLDNAFGLLSKLLPSKTKQFSKLEFPRASFTVEMIEGLLSKLKDLEVLCSNLIFPSSNKPSSVELEYELQRFAKETLKMPNEISWEEI